MRRSKRLQAIREARSTVPPAEATSDSLTKDWNSIPPEIQEKILKKVTTREDLLKCRLVNSAWKRVFDRSLEEQVVSLWTKWVPFHDFNTSFETQMLDIPNMELCPPNWFSGDGQVRGLSWNHSSLPRVENPNLGSPFPTNSMKITMLSDVRRATGLDAREMMVKELFVNYGHYLTSFVLSNFKLNADFKSLSGILEPLINLKALALENITCVVGIEAGPNSYRRKSIPTDKVAPLKLPPLPKLVYLKMISCEKEVSNLLINSYSNQLLYLETGLWLRPSHASVKFQNLKRLKLTEDLFTNNGMFPKVKPTQFPALEYYSENHLNHAFRWSEILRALKKLPKTLVHLHLSLQNPEKDMFDSDDEEEFNPESLKSTTFPLLKSLAIPFPPNSGQAERVGRWLLPKFRNIETLHLLNYVYDNMSYRPNEGQRPYYFDVNREVIDQLVTTAGFWTECKKLKKIFLYKEGNPESILHLERAIFIS